MSARKVMVVFGTRPEAIKMALVIKALRTQNSGFECRVVVTGQHRQMLDQVLDVFNIEPDIDLNVMQPEQKLSELTAVLLQRLTDVMANERPDVVLVQGDTTTTFCGALAAFYNKIPVGHIEAGLRSFDLANPYPEELNRTLTSSLADWHFVPTKTAYNNLLGAGVLKEKIFLTGNTVVDALFYALERLGPEHDRMLPRIGNGKRMILVTAHRRENWDNELANICEAVKTIKSNFSDTEFVFSVHLNPRVKRIVHQALGGLEGIHLTEPLDYLPFVRLMSKSYFILTDSGGMQEEAPSLGKPVLVLRKVTERPEGVEAGAVEVIGTRVVDIVSHCSDLLENVMKYEQMSRATNPYGDGQAANRIVEILANTSEPLGQFCGSAQDG